ncbi:Baculoviral IAP repeat-containing protein 5 [Chamberlinius hualienensis]
MTSNSSELYKTLNLTKALIKYPKEMSLEENRKKSFLNWPFEEDCNCTSQKMAEAGFYHCRDDHAPDLVCCFVCLKELEGWEPDDKPWDEHKSHCPKCPFVLLGKKTGDLTLKEFVKLEAEKQSIRTRKISDYLNEQLNVFNDTVLVFIQSLDKY